jgi:outer membrane protein TolC
MARFAPARWLAAITALALSASGARDARGDSITHTTSPDSALGVALARIEGEPLSLEEAIENALDFSTQVHEAEAVFRAAQGAERREKGTFDPVLFADLERREDNQPAASLLQGAGVVEDQETFAAAGARLKLPLGTELAASLETTRLETNSAFFAFNPSYSSTGLLEVRQPLLKGFGPATSRDLTSAEREVEAAFSRYEDAALGMQAEVTSTYWDLFAAERDYAVQRLIVDRAEAFLEEARLRSDAGLVGPNEVATARVFLAQQQLMLLDAEEEMDEISDALGTLMGRRPTLDTSRFRPVTEPPSEFPIEDRAELLERSLRHNGELLSARQMLEAVEAQAEGAKWDAYPTLDVTGSLGANGLAGTFVPDSTAGAPPEERLGDASDAISQVFTADNPLWSVGVHFSWPIGTRTGRGERDRLRAEVDRARQRVIEIERSLEEEVRFFHRELVNGSRRLEVALDGVNASLEQVRIGQIEYGNGRTTAFELVRLGADAAEAQQRYSDALVRTAKAAAELERLAPKDLASLHLRRSN